MPTLTVVIELPETIMTWDAKAREEVLKRVQFGMGIEHLMPPTLEPTDLDTWPTTINVKVLEVVDSEDENDYSERERFAVPTNHERVNLYRATSADEETHRSAYVMAAWENEGFSSVYRLWDGSFGIYI